METFRWAGWRDEAKLKVVGSGMDKAYVGPSYNTQNRKQTCTQIATFDSCGARTIKGGMKIYIELQKHTRDQMAARNIRISLNKRIAYSR